MSIFVLTCKNCNHKFYDIIVLCTGESVEGACPICKGKDLEVEKMDKPNTKDWAEEEGCHHGDPTKFVHGKNTKHQSACDPGKPCDCSDFSEERTLDEEIDLRIEQSQKNEMNSYILPKNLKSELEKPWGEVLEIVPVLDKKNPIIAIGDVSTKNLLSKFIVPTLAIIDNKVQRIELPVKDRVSEKFFDKILFFPNPPSRITRRLYQSVERVSWDKLTSHTLISIDGEEDIATLVCILHAPIGSHIFYGQPNKGLVHIILDKKIKYKAEDLFNQFETE